MVPGKRFVWSKCCEAAILLIIICCLFQMFTGKATSLSRVSTAKHFSAGGRFIFCKEESQIKPRVLSEEKWELN